MRDAISRETQIVLDDVEEISSLYTKFKKISDEVENFVKNNNNKMLKKLRNVLMNENQDFSNNFQKNLIYSIIHFLAIAEINDVLFALLEEIKISLPYLIKYKEKYNPGQNNYYVFFKEGVKYDSSQINFNYLSALLSNILINLLGDDIIYLICSLSNIGILILLYYAHLDNIKNEYSNVFTHFIKILLFYIFIYIFTGIIALIPLYSMNNRFSGKNIIAINSYLFLGVASKYAIHIALSHYIEEKHLYFAKLGIYVICSFVYLILHIENFKSKSHTSYSYFFGKLTYRNKSSSIKLQFQNLGGYLKSLIYSSVIVIFVLNFLSRAQKIAFKTRFKEEFDSKWFMPLNFFLSYAIYIIVMIIFNFIQNNKLKSYLINYDKNQGKIALFRDNSQSENLVEDEEEDDNNSKSYIEKEQEGDKIKK